MTEAEWLAPGDLRAHIEFLRSKRFAHKPRLFGVACCRPFEPWMYDAVMKEALLRSELLADGEISAATIQKWRQKLDRAERARWKRPGKRAHLADPERTAYYAIRFACHEGGNSGFCESWRPLVRSNA